MLESNNQLGEKSVSEENLRVEAVTAAVENHINSSSTSCRDNRGLITEINTDNTHYFRSLGSIVLKCT